MISSYSETHKTVEYEDDIQQIISVLDVVLYLMFYQVAWKSMYLFSVYTEQMFMCLIELFII